MNETLFALVLVFSPTTAATTEEVYTRNIPFYVCDEAQKAVWEMEAPIAGYDDEGNPIPEFDAYCVSMDDVSPDRYTISYF